ncbi:MAG TPA: hypothetical protein DCR20_12265 [Planctomycetaceae bacterium]|nr:hypothetical protein [Planctomycetaceae bacterium]
MDLPWKITARQNRCRTPADAKLQGLCLPRALQFYQHAGNLSGHIPARNVGTAIYQESAARI